MAEAGVTLKSKAAMEGNCEVSVYAAVDVSGSMMGSKCDEMCDQLKQIIQDCPDDVLFDITLFSTTAWKGVTALKSTVRTDQLTKDITTACGRKGMTALYDAWGDMLTNIPAKAFKYGVVQIFVLTDGEDNCSEKYNKDSVMELTKNVIGGNIQSKFNFIQVGQAANRNVVSTLKNINWTGGNGRINSFVVDDSAKGIRSAMSTIHADILLSTRGRNYSNATTMKNPLDTDYYWGTKSSAAAGSRSGTNATAPAASYATGLGTNFTAADLFTTNRSTSSRKPGSSSGTALSVSQSGTRNPTNLGQSGTETNNNAGDAANIIGTNTSYSLK